MKKEKERQKQAIENMTDEVTFFDKKFAKSILGFLGLSKKTYQRS